MKYLRVPLLVSLAGTIVQPLWASAAPGDDDVNVGTDATGESDTTTAASENALVSEPVATDGGSIDAAESPTTITAPVAVITDTTYTADASPVDNAPPEATVSSGNDDNDGFSVSGSDEDSEGESSNSNDEDGPESASPQEQGPNSPQGPISSNDIYWVPVTPNDAVENSSSTSANEGSDYDEESQVPVLSEGDEISQSATENGDTQEASGGTQENVDSEATETDQDLINTTVEDSNGPVVNGAGLSSESTDSNDDFGILASIVDQFVEETEVFEDELRQDEFAEETDDFEDESRLAELVEATKNFLDAQAQIYQDIVPEDLYSEDDFGLAALFYMPDQVDLVETVDGDSDAQQQEEDSPVVV